MADQVDADFVRFFGRRVTDPENDQRDCKVHDGEQNLGLRSDASLLAIANRYGALLMGAKGGLQWAWLAGLRKCCQAGSESGCASKQLSSVVELPDAAAPHLLRLSCDDTLLAVATVGASAHELVVFDVRALLASRCAPLSRPPNGPHRASLRA